MAENKITNSCNLLVIGGSASSLEVLFKILPLLNNKLKFPIVVVLHRKNSYNQSLAELLASRCKIPVSESEDKEFLLSNHIYLAPGDYHLLFEKNNSMSLDFSEKVNYSRPSIDVSFESAADIYKENLVCILLSGANADGAEGLKIVQQNGGKIAVQNPENAGSPVMPETALSIAKVDNILEVNDIAAFINAL